MFEPVIYNFDIWVNSDYPFSFDVPTDELNLTGSSLVFDFKNNGINSINMIITNVDAETQRVSCDIPHTSTSKFQKNVNVPYKIQLNIAGKQFPIISGNMMPKDF